MGAGKSKERKLYDGVRKRNLCSIISLHCNGASLDFMSRSRKTPLILACSSANRYLIAKAIIDLGAGVNYYDPEGNVGTALQRAARRGLEKTVILLLSHGANPLLRNLHRPSALEIARQGRHTGIVRAIEDKICFFSGWLRHIPFPDLTNRSAHRIWAVVYPGDSAVSSDVSNLKIAVYLDRECSRPFSIGSLEKFDVLEPDFLIPDPELVLCNKLFEGDVQQLKLLYDTCTGKMKKNEPRSEGVALAGVTPPRRPQSSPVAASTPLTAQEKAEIAMAIASSIQTAAEEGISLSKRDTLLALSTGDGARAAGVGTSGASFSCVICNDAHVEAACVPCGHLAGCMACLTEVKMKDFGCPICRARIKRIMKIYTV